MGVIVLYIFNLMFSPMSMYYQIKMGAFREEFSKNTVYRFLELVCNAWYDFAAGKKAGLTVITRPKTNSKQYYEYEGRMMNI